MRISPSVAAVLDIVLVTVFALIGRLSHGEDAAGVLVTAWPFLVGAAAGWLIWFGARRAAPVGLAGGVVVWLACLVGGMLLRSAVGLGTATPFIVVAAIATGLFLLGWRALAALTTRRTVRERR